MKRLKVILGFITTVILLTAIYFLLIADNIFIHLSNHSWDGKPVYVRAWIGDDQVIEDVIYADQLVFEDSVKADLTGRKDQVYTTRKKVFGKFEIKIEVNNGDEVFKDTIELERFSFVYISVDSEDNGLRSVDVSSYNLAQAWKMNLIFPVKE